MMFKQRNHGRFSIENKMVLKKVNFCTNLKPCCQVPLPRQRQTTTPLAGCARGGHPLCLAGWLSPPARTFPVPAVMCPSGGRSWLRDAPPGRNEHPRLAIFCLILDLQ